jgi:hypothetical protein
MKLDTVREQESAVVELSTIVTLDTPDGATKLRGHVSIEVRGWRRCQTLAQRKGPRVMSAIIENNQVILITKNTKYKRGTKMTVNQIKRLYTPRRTRKR